MKRTTGLYKDKTPVGRPTSYKPEYVELAFNYALLGASDKEMCRMFGGITEKTFHEWRRQHPDFLKSLDEGRDIADGKVARTLYQRAVGYKYVDEHVTVQKIKLPGGGEEVEIIKTPVTKFVPPDIGAGKLFLNIRRRGNRVDKDSVQWTEINGKELTGANGESLFPTDLTERAKQSRARLLEEIDE